MLDDSIRVVPESLKVLQLLSEKNRYIYVPNKKLMVQIARAYSERENFKSTTYPEEHHI